MAITVIYDNIYNNGEWCGALCEILKNLQVSGAVIPSSSGSCSENSLKLSTPSPRRYLTGSPWMKHDETDDP